MSTNSVTIAVGKDEGEISYVAVRNNLLNALTISSGAVDAVSFLALGKVFTAFMTGNFAFLSRRELVGLHEIRWIGRCALVSDPVNLKRPDDILEFHLPHSLRRTGKAVRYLIEDLLGNTNAALCGQGYNPSGDVNACDDR